MNDTLVSLIRTWVPILVGSALTWLSTALDITDFDTTGVATAVTGLVIAIYYAVVRIAEKRWPVVGIFLGKRTQPTYDGPSTPEVPRAA